MSSVPAPSPRLLIQKSLDEIKELYAQDPKISSFKAIVYGDFGSGKTTAACTGRAPVLLHSFDPGGTTSVRDKIASGIVYADTRFEVESCDDVSKIQAYNLWRDAFKKLLVNKVFDGLGTYVLDSLTTMSEAILNQILKAAGRPNSIPQIQDYQHLGNALRDMMKVLASLPCDVVVVGHMEAEKDEITGRINSSLMVTGKMKNKLPLLFDEVYVALPKDTNAGVQYQLLTQNDGVYKARTRIGAGGKFNKYEPANLRGLLAKAGLPSEDIR